MERSCSICGSTGNVSKNKCNACVVKMKCQCGAINAINATKCSACPIIFRDLKAQTRMSTLKKRREEGWAGKKTTKYYVDALERAAAHAHGAGLSVLCLVFKPSGKGTLSTIIEEGCHQTEIVSVIKEAFNDMTRCKDYVQRTYKPYNPTSASTSATTSASTFATSKSAPTLPSTSVPTLPSTSVPTLPSTSVPTLPSTSAPTLPSTSAPTLPSTSVPTLPSTSVPTLPSTSTPTLSSTSVPTLPSTSVPTLPSTSAPTLPSTSAPTLPSTSVPTLPSTFAPTLSSTSAHTSSAPTLPFTSAPRSATTTTSSTTPTPTKAKRCANKAWHTQTHKCKQRKRPNKQRSRNTTPAEYINPNNSDSDAEEILSEKLDKNGRTLYLVKWKHYSSQSNTWEPSRNLKQTLALLNYKEHVQST
ncbi:mucin-2-like [Watersipora subatra]|uniref:mucin-2-like n=2 Tax=Watersipora subatra TaxID=2589382 RepID=UPI00355BAD4B